MSIRRVLVDTVSVSVWEVQRVQTIHCQYCKNLTSKAGSGCHILNIHHLYFPPSRYNHDIINQANGNILMQQLNIYYLNSKEKSEALSRKRLTKSALLHLLKRLFGGNSSPHGSTQLIFIFFYLEPSPVKPGIFLDAI